MHCDATLWSSSSKRSLYLWKVGPWKEGQLPAGHLSDFPEHLASKELNLRDQSEVQVRGKVQRCAHAM